MVQSLENIDKSKVSATRIEGLEGIVEDTISNTLTGAVSTITTSDLTANKVLVSDANGKVAASTKAISDIPDDSDLVHKSGEENIDGRKIFNDNILIKNDSGLHSGFCQRYYNISKGTIPTQENSVRWWFYDATGFSSAANCIAGIDFHYTTSGSSSDLRVFKPELNSTETEYIGITYTFDGNVITHAPTPATDDVSSKIATTAWVNHQGYAVDSNVVHTSGTQTISGTKTFTGTQNLNGNTLKCFNFAKGTNPSSTQYANFYLTDNTASNGDNTALGRFRTQVNSEGLVSTSMTAFKNTAGNASSSIAIYYPTTGDPYTYTLTPTDTTTTNGTQIATTGWVNTTGNNVVHLNEAETITGGKTFTASPEIKKTKPQLFLKDTSITRGTAPSSAVNTVTINGIDSADKNTWGIYHTWGTDKKAQTQLICYKGTTTDNTWAGIGVGYDASGNVFTNAPTPATSDNSTKIATTAFVKSVLSTSGQGLFTISKAANGYCKFNGGLIVQWGTNQASNTTMTITFPTSFSNTNYTIGGTCNNGKAAFVPERTSKTQFRLDASGGIGTTIIYWIAVGY